MGIRPSVIVFVLFVGGLTPACSLFFFDSSGYSGGGPNGTSDAGDVQVDGVVDALAFDTATNGDTTPGKPSAYATAVLADKPIGYWRLGESTGAIAVDQMGKTPGTYVGAKLGVAGATADGDTAVDFTNAQVQLGQGFAFPGTKSFTCEAWILPRKVDDLFRRFLGRKQLASPRHGYSFGVHVPEGIYLDRWIDDVVIDTSIAFPTTPGFHHVVGTYDGAAVRLYVDGVLAAGPTADTRLMPDHIADELIGAATTTGEQAFDGVIDEVAIYDIALPANRVLEHFNAAKR